MRDTPHMAVVTVSLALIVGRAHAQPTSIHPLLPPPGVSVTYMYAWDVSADGQWAVGYYQNAVSPFNNVAVRWPLSGPDAYIAQAIPLPGWSGTQARQASGDGSVIIGFGNFAGSTSQSMFRWTPSGVTRVTNAGTAAPTELAPDGVHALVDGLSITGAVINTASDTIVRSMPAGFYARDMSDDASIVVGEADDFPYNAARSTAQNNLEQLCGIIGCGTGNDYTRPDSSVISNDGSTWAGVIRQPGTGYGGYAASLFLYRNGQLTTVPNQCGTFSEPQVNAANADGSVLVGSMYFCGSGSSAFHYSTGRGMQPVDAILADAGVDLSGWTRLEYAWSVSASGRVVVGDGQVPTTAFNRPFVAVIPPPCDTIDFNGDLLFPDTQDIADFLSVFAGGVCAGQQPGDVPCNGDIDFNNDLLLPDAADIGSIIRVFGGGPC